MLCLLFTVMPEEHRLDVLLLVLMSLSKADHALIILLDNSEDDHIERHLTTLDSNISVSCIISSSVRPQQMFFPIWRATYQANILHLFQPLHRSHFRVLQGHAQRILPVTSCS